MLHIYIYVAYIYIIDFRNCSVWTTISLLMCRLCTDILAMFRIAGLLYWPYKMYSLCRSKLFYCVEWKMHTLCCTELIYSADLAGCTRSACRFVVLTSHDALAMLHRADLLCWPCWMHSLLSPLCCVDVTWCTRSVSQSRSCVLIDLARLFSLSSPFCCTGIVRCTFSVS